MTTKSIIGCALLLMICGVLTIWLLQTEMTSAETIYVDDEGSDTTGNGTEGNPYATIQKGVDEANESDTVFIMEGTYNQKARIQKTKSVICVWQIRLQVSL